MNRRGWLRMTAMAGAGASALQLLGCGSNPVAPTVTAPEATGTGATAGTGTNTGTSGTSACTTRVPEETAGPYPGDGSNGPNVLSQSGIVRSDIRSSFGGSSGTADGVGLTIALTLVSASTCQPLAGYAVYLWQCDRQGRYSLYTAGATSQNYLRGVQPVESSGRVSFTSIFPACYMGRWPHIHFEVYPSLSGATSASNKVATSQIALPKRRATSSTPRPATVQRAEPVASDPGKRHGLCRRCRPRTRGGGRERRVGIPRVAHDSRLAFNAGLSGGTAVEEDRWRPCHGSRRTRCAAHRSREV